MILASAFTIGFVLSLLMALASLARSGFRGRLLLFLGCLPLGAVLGGLELVIRPEEAVIVRYLGDLRIEIAAAALARALVFALVLGSALDTATSTRWRTRRCADVLTAGAGCGLGFGLTTTIFMLAEAGDWAPAGLVIAVSNMPMQLCVAFMLAASIAARRQGQSPLHLLFYAGGFLIEAAYQAIIATTGMVGHWLAWIEPGRVAWLWSSLMLLAWLVGMMVMNAQRRIEEPAHRAARSVWSVRIWMTAAGFVLIPSLVLLVLLLSDALSGGLERILLLALLAIPLMCGAIVLRTALELQRR